MSKSISVLFLLVIFVFSFIATSSTAWAASFVFNHDLSLGVRSSDVSTLQQFLIDEKFLFISTPTGYFGPATKTAVRKWQTSVGINSPTGYFGRLSRKKISSRSIQTLAPLPTEPSITKISVTTTSSSTATTSTPVMIKTNDGHPIRFKIPKLNIDAAFQYNGLKPDGTMEIPNNVTDVGWFTGSVKPGEKGTSVVTGHVAQIRGGVVTKPGVFSNLSDLKPGDKFSVTNDKGVVFTFIVRESRSYDPNADATDVFGAKDDGSHLNIITCEGTWNPGQLSYSQRLVVFTDLEK